MTTEKTCFKCNQTKPLTKFYRHPRMADGHLNKCKDCTKSDTRATRLARLDYYLEYDRNRGSLPSRVKARAAYAKTERGKYVKRRGMATYSASNPLRRVAHTAVGNAIRDGKLLRSPCEICGSHDHVHAHHDDYTKPLNVRWLCRACHVEWHRHNRALPYTTHCPKITGESHG